MEKKWKKSKISDMIKRNIKERKYERKKIEKELKKVQIEKGNKSLN